MEQMTYQSFSKAPRQRSVTPGVNVELVGMQTLKQMLEMKQPPK